MTQSGRICSPAALSWEAVLQHVDALPVELPAEDVGGHGVLTMESGMAASEALMAALWQADVLQH